MFSFISRIRIANALIGDDDRRLVARMIQNISENKFHSGRVQYNPKVNDDIEFGVQQNQRSDYNIVCQSRKEVKSRSLHVATVEGRIR